MNPSEPDKLTPLLLYDGVCGLCNRVVRFVLPRSKTVRFAPLQSGIAGQLLDNYGLSSREIDTVVLVDEDGAHTHSTAALRLTRHLASPWPLLSVLLWVPRRLRDAAYRWVARNRYDWFGKLDSCPLPSDDEASRFLG